MTRTKLVPAQENNPYKFSVYRNSAQNCGNAALAKINFDTKSYDPNSNFDNVTNFRYVAPVTGYYHFDTSVTYVTGGASSSPMMAFYKNGTVGKLLFQSFYSGNITLSIAGSTDLLLTAGDYVEVFLQGLGGAITTGPSNTSFNGHLINV